MTARPPAPIGLLTAAGFGLVMALSLAALLTYAFFANEFALGRRFVWVVSVHAAGGFVGSAVAVLAAARLVSVFRASGVGMSAAKRGCLIGLGLAVALPAGFAGAIFVTYLLVFEELMPLLSRDFFNQLLYTAAVSAWIVLSSGLRLLLPAGLLPLGAAIVWFSWKTRRSRS